ncbi:MAG TPA: preprotein translocase subunit SecG [Candidatus Saccharimonadales bacterium]|nr:preprotein translocase subunit SecG [Candidatus Saccharimonadales bacterium]
MNIQLITQILQIIFSVFLVVAILIQSKGVGLYSGVGGSIGFYRSRRGLEKLIFVMTIIVAVALAVNSIVITLVG